MQNFDTQQEVTIDEADPDDIMDGDMPTTRKSLTKSSDLEAGSTPGKKSNQKYQKSREPDIIEQCAKAYTENPRPRRLGKMYAFWYNSKNEPRIVVGPDFWFSLLELALTNGIIGLILNTANSGSTMWVLYAGLGILIFHDVAFLGTIMWPQGLPPRNPNAHSKGYLNKVKTVE